MRLAFPSLGQMDSNSTAETLALHQVRLHDKKATALIEITLEGSQRVHLLYAHGVQAGVYRSDGDEYQHMAVSDLAPIWSNGPKSMRVVPLHDLAGRLMWLTYESNRRTSVRGSNINTWTQQLRAWKLEGMNGLAEMRSDTAHGYFYFRRGEPVEAESTVLHSDGKISSTFELADVETKWEADVFDINPANKPAQCLILRQAAFDWIQAVFDSYKNIAGEKFLLVMVRELQTQIRPWNWNIRMEHRGVLDEHFFPGAEATAHAYRAILMGMGAQMSFALGNYLTQRIMTEMFNELEQGQRANLETHRLIPAAFS